jgi:hypothetical protein
MKEININSLPKDVAEEIKKKLVHEPKYMELARKRAEFARNGNYVLAMQTFDAMKKVEQIVTQEYAKRYMYEVVRVQDLISSMEEEDRDLMNAYGAMLSIVADMFDTLIMDANQLLNKYHADYRIEMFDKLAKLGKEAKKQVQLLDNAKTEDKYYINLYGDTCDKTYEMTLNKSKSFINKMKKHEESVNKKTKLKST